MNANVVTALAALLGSVAGASAAIATAWISQRSQTRRELAKSEMRKRETLYGEFITEAARLLSDAFDHTLDKPETLVKLYAILGRIRLVSSEAVFNAAEECSSRILDLRYAEPHGRRAHRRYSKRRNGVSEEIQRRLPCRVRQIFPILKNRRPQN
jgi:hypothetical protein